MGRRDPAERSLTAIPAAGLRRAHRMFLLVCLALPVLITAAAVWLIAAWLPELPDPAATHWGPHGVNGYGAPSLYLWMAIGIGLGLPALLALCTLTAVRGQWGGAARLLGALALGLSGFSAVVNAGSVAVQRGAGTADEAGGIGGVLLSGAGVLVALTALGWLAQPRVRPAPAAPLERAQAAAITGGEPVVWLATATMSRAGMVVMALLLVLMVGITAVMAVAAAEGVWIPLLALVLIGLAFASAASFRVRIGPDGLSVRSQIGFPRVRVPLDEIASVRAVQCHPFGEFGGWGWRLGLDGRTGVVVRTGPAIEVERRDRRPLVVTVDGAAVGAAVLQAHLDARRAAPGRPGAPESKSRRTTSAGSAGPGAERAEPAEPPDPAEEEQP